MKKETEEAAKELEAAEAAKAAEVAAKLEAAVQIAEIDAAIVAAELANKSAIDEATENLAAKIAQLRLAAEVDEQRVPTEKAATAERKRVKEAARKRERVQRLQPGIKAAQAHQEAKQLQEDYAALQLRRRALDQEIEANQRLVSADEKAAGWTEVSSRRK